MLDQEHGKYCEIRTIGNVGGVETQSRSLFDSNGISPTLSAGMSHGNTVPYIIERLRTPYERRNRDYDGEKQIYHQSHEW